MLRDMKTVQRGVRVLPLRVKGTGTAAVQEGSAHATLVDNGVGDWTLTFRQPFTRTPVVTIGSVNVAIVKMMAVSTTAVQIQAFEVDGTTAKDIDFHLLVCGFDVADQT